MARTAAHLVEEQETQRCEQDAARRKGGEKPSQPRAGRTGMQGSRAERPADGTHRTSDPATPPHTGRGGKAPSATGPKAHQAGSGQKNGSGKSDEDLPQAARDSTT